MRTASDAHVGQRTDAVVAASQRLVQLRPVRVDRASFESAVIPCLRGLRSLALRLTRSASDADDLLQETLLRAYRFWPRYQERDSCRAWLQRILKNVFRSEYRRRVRQRLHLDDFEAQTAIETSADSPGSDAPAPAAAAPQKELLDERLSRGLSSLSSEHRDVIWLVDVNERSYREAADQLACPIGTVMSRLHRARSALRSALLAQA